MGVYDCLEDVQVILVSADLQLFINCSFFMGSFVKLFVSHMTSVH
jgi:hypothetical protein